MLPQGYHEQACKLFCKWLRRLEEMDRNNGQETAEELGRPEHRLHAIMGSKEVANQLPMSNVSPCEHQEAEKERQRRDAEG